MKPPKWVNRWQGQTVVCIASGPSLTPEDCEAVKGLRTIVTNNTYQLCPWADVLFAFDGNWWAHYYEDAKRVFQGAMISYCTNPTRWPDVETVHGKEWFKHFHNSGGSAISLAITAGASRVILLGYDCQRTGGKTHWHGDHPKTLSNARSIGNWPQQFKNVARFASSKGVPIINCTPTTALTCFPRATLAEALEEVAV
jgi:hypothetical protein